jgi:hypothetical protein
LEVSKKNKQTNKQTKKNNADSAIGEDDLPLIPSFSSVPLLNFFKEEIDIKKKCKYHTEEQSQKLPQPTTTTAIRLVTTNNRPLLNLNFLQMSEVRERERKRERKENIDIFSQSTLISQKVAGMYSMFEIKPNSRSNCE